MACIKSRFFLFVVRFTRYFIAEGFTVDSTCLSTCTDRFSFQTVIAPFNQIVMETEKFHYLSVNTKKGKVHQIFPKRDLLNNI